MPLPHFTQLLMTGSPGGPGTRPQEPVYKNLFEITFIMPTILQAQGRDPIMMLQQATSIDLNLTEDIERATQRFKYSTRKFVTTPGDTSKEFTIKFNVNVNEKGAMETWNALKAWYDLVWNSQNGVLHYKADIIGTIIVNEHDRKGLVLRRVTYQNAQIYGIDGIQLDWSQNTEIWEVNAKFVADYWIDEYIDGNFVITPPRIAGYP
jgi:hypothetical protein